MNPSAWTRALRERTTPSSAAIHRVRRRLDLQLAPATAELSRLPAVEDAAVRRVRARIRAAGRATEPGWPVRIVGLGLAATAMAMAAAVTLTTSGPGPVAAEQYLAGSGQGALAEHVLATHDGQGRVVTGPDGVVIDWELGRLDLDVTPGEGVTLLVQTPEGAVRVVGTRLTVARGALGTTVSVAQGEVAVTCTGEAEVPVRAGGRAECWPTSPAGLLNRARALQDAGAGADEVLATVDRGLEAPGLDGPVRGELLALQTGALVAAGRDAEALDAAEAAIAASSDPGRAVSLRRTAARLALRLGACERARRQIEAIGEATEERALLERCD
jgi:hypothetical protein